MTFVLALLVCYLIGSVPTAYWLVRLTTGTDVRTVGSGNVGATNAMRTAGPVIGVIVLLVDILKGVLAVWLVPRAVLNASGLERILACGLAAVLGHIFPCFLRFRGGKGVATTLGMLLGSMPIIAAIVMGTWIIGFALTRYVSIGSLVAAVAIPTAQLIMRQSLPAVLLGACLAVLIIVRHRANIQRLLGGVEHRAWSRKGH